MASFEIDAPTTPLSWSAIRVTGPEASAYLQGQLSQDLETLGESGWSLLLAPDSVVVTTLLVRRHDDGFELVVPAGLAEAALARLRRFRLRAKVDFDLQEGVEGPFSTLEERIEANWPGEEEFAKGLTPHVFGRALVDATISFTKGCFTGQELVGRLDARGASVPWRFVRAEGPSIDRLNEMLRSKGPAEGPQGVTSAVQRGDRVLGLGFAHRTLLGVATSLVEGEVTISAIG